MSDLDGGFFGGVWQGLWLVGMEMAGTPPTSTFAFEPEEQTVSGQVTVSVHRYAADNI